MIGKICALCPISQCKEHPTQSEVVCPSCSASTAVASVIAAIVTALLATVIFVLVQIAVCKWHPKFTPGRAETSTLAGGEVREYEEVEVGVASSDPEVGGEIAFQLKKNESYAMNTYA